jgi:hypothetical protein
MPLRRLETSTLDDSDPPRRVPLCDPAGNKDLPEEVRTRIASTLGQEASLTWSMEVRREHIVLLLAVTAAMVLLLVIPVSLNGFELGLVAAGGSLLAGAIGMKRARRRTAGSVRSSLLAAGHCPSCGYGLASINAGEDGQRVCPECGAAWRMAAMDELPPGDRPRWRPLPLQRVLLASGLMRAAKDDSFSWPDDRGRIVELVYPRPKARPPGMWGTLGAEEQREITSALASLIRGPQVVHVLFVLWMAGMGLWAIVSGSVGTSLLQSVLIVGLVFFLIYAGAQGIFRPTVSDRRHVADVLLRRSRCGSCSGDLAAIDPEGDGCTVCPNCRAAWRIPRTTLSARSHVRTAAAPDPA